MRRNSLKLGAMKLPNPFILFFNGTALTTWFATKLGGGYVGKDNFGNRYYKKVRKGEREKRWVLYNGMPEPTKVTPEWHGWLHYTLDAPPTERPARAHVWQKSAQPNLSGTKAAYQPAGLHGVHAPNTAEYEPWTP